jgi:hypothetical protein
VTRLLAFAVGTGIVAALAIGIALAADGADGPPAERPTFEPADGWDTRSTGETSPPQAPAAVTANVPIDPADEAGGLPLRTLDRLPADGLVVWATFYPLEGGFEGSAPRRTLPLQLSDATGGVDFEGQPANVTTRRVTARLDRYEVDVLLFFGRADPPAETLQQADAALARLIPPG